MVFTIQSNGIICNLDVCSAHTAMPVAVKECVFVIVLFCCTFLFRRFILFHSSMNIVEYYTLCVAYLKDAIKCS